MLAPIPAQLLRHSATLRVCSGVDAYQTAIYTDHALTRVCVQPTHVTRKTRDNTDAELLAVCFVDVRLSRPHGLDIAALKAQADAAGGDLRLVYSGQEYVVVGVDMLCDDTGRLHHYELALGGAAYGS